MDPFNGLGSTAVACARLGLNFIGSDIDETYLAEAVDRVEAATAGRDLPGRGAAPMAKVEKARKAALRATAASAKAPRASGA
jgi:site-specific DNA-methyltransferase (adenine-specific)